MKRISIKLYDVTVDMLDSICDRKDWNKSVAIHECIRRMYIDTFQPIHDEQPEMLAQEER